MKNLSFFCRARLVLFVVSIAGLTGCGPEKKEESVSASSSGFKPADADKSSGISKKNLSSDADSASAANSTPSQSNTARSNATNSTNESPKQGTTASSSSGGAAAKSTSSGTSKGYPSEISGATKGLGGTGELQAAPELPKFDPSKLDPAIAGKSYYKLSLTDTQDPKELVRLILSLDRSVEELLKDNARRLIAPDQLVDRGMAISRMKLTASERLIKVATTPEEKAKALVGKLESLFQMSQFKDDSSSDELRVVAKEMSQNEDSRVATHARRIQLVVATNDFNNQAVEGTALAEAIKDLMKDLSTPDGPSFMVAAQAAQILASREDSEEACDQAIDAIEKTYRNASVVELGMTAWQMKIQRLKDFEEIVQILDTRLAAGATPENIRAAAQRLMDRIPSPWTAYALTKSAQQFEHVRRRELAKEIFDIAATQVDNSKCKEAKEFIQSTINGFTLRSNIVGKPFALDELVDTAGAPLKLEDLKGKVVLIDFWATWCGPCIQEIPKLKKLYEDMHDKGFEMVSINLDDQRADVESFLTQKPMLWKTYWSSNGSKMGMNTKVAASVGLNAIPLTILVDRNGNVAETHLLGADLEKKVAELLAQSPKSGE